MNDKIEVGEYVRTKKGIAKVTNIDDLDNVAWTDKKGIYFGVIRKSGYLDWHIYDDGTVLREPSFNIIDLIEVGDYVNGYKIIDKISGYLYTEVFNPNGDYKTICDYQIESIVTKEQFNSVKYEVEI